MLVEEIKSCLQNVERTNTDVRNELNRYAEILQNKNHAILLVRKMMADLRTLSKSFADFTIFESDLLVRRRKRLLGLVKQIKLWSLERKVLKWRLNICNELHWTYTTSDNVSQGEWKTVAMKQLTLLLSKPFFKKTDYRLRQF